MRVHGVRRLSHMCVGQYKLVNIAQLIQTTKI